MEDAITLTFEEYDYLIRLFSAVLDWKAARLSLQMLQNQGESEEIIAKSQHDLVVCERALSHGASSRIGRRLFMASQGMYSDGDSEVRGGA